MYGKAWDYNHGPGTSQLFHMQNYVRNPPLLPPPFNAEIGVMQKQFFYSIFNSAQSGEEALWIKLTPVNVQLSQPCISPLTLLTACPSVVTPSIVPAERRNRRSVTDAATTLSTVVVFGAMSGSPPTTILLLPVRINCLVPP